MGLFQFTGTNQNRLTGCATLVCGEWKVPGSNLLKPSLLPQLSAAAIVRRAGTGLWLEEDGSSAPSLSPPAKHPSPPPPSPSPSHGLCLWLNAGILSQRLLVAKRAGAPEKLGKCMWVTASQKGAFHSPRPSFFSPPFCAFVPLWLPPSLLLTEQITLMCAGLVSLNWFSWTGL